MTENNQKGFITELHCELYFTNKGLLLSKPILQDSRYDYILDIQHRLYKIQCKSCTEKDNGDKIVFKTHMTNIRQGTTTYYSSRDVDFFYTYFNGKHYLVPFDKAGKGETTLRFKSASPNHPNIRWAYNYEADIILKMLEEEVV